MRYLSLAIVLAGLIAAPAMANDKARPRPSPEMTDCFESCKKHKDATRYEECMNRCVANFPMLPPEKPTPRPAKKTKDGNP
jgi:hypothetical protein